MNNKYGKQSDKQILNEIFNVCKCIGYGKNNNADELLVRTLFAETNFGETPDTIKNSGFGIAQFDYIGFIDTLTRTLQNFGLCQKIIKYLNIDLIRITSIKLLENNTLLSILFCRLKYRLIKEEIPIGLEAQAAYWKKYYNSAIGKGTVEHFIEMNSSKYAIDIFNEMKKLRSDFI